MSETPWVDDGTLGLWGLGLTLATRGSSHPALAGWKPGLLGAGGALVKGPGSCLELTARREEAGKTRQRGVGFKHALSVFIERLLYAGI